MKRLMTASILAVSMVMGATGCSVLNRQTTAGQAVDDATISARVKTRFAQDPQVSAMRINVDTLNGTVQLSGFATSEAERTRAGQIARGVPDVKEVRNNIVVRPPAR